MQVIVLLLFTADHIHQSTEAVNIGVGGVVIQTPALYAYQVYWPVSHIDNFKFKVNSSYAALYLRNNAMLKGLEILFGATGHVVYSCIRQCMWCTCSDQAFVHGSPLTLGVRKDFWIFWNSAFMSTGAAVNIGENMFFTYRFENKDPFIHRIFISTYVSITGIWEMPDYLTFVTKSNIRNTTIYWDVAGVSSALFSIETCGSVDIIFTTNLAHLYYKVGLGDCSDWCTSIQKVVSNNTESTPITVGVDINPLNSSHNKDVWISWENTTNRLEVGTGQVLHQNVIVAMDNMEKDALVERMTIQSSLSAKWKIDVYGCKLYSWTSTNPTCHCARPSFHPTFDGDFHCDREPVVQKMEREYYVEPFKNNTWRSEGHVYSTTLAKWIITTSSRIKCGVECELWTPCSIFSYHKLNQSCWLYDAQQFDMNDFTENKNYKTYVRVTHATIIYPLRNLDSPGRVVDCPNF